MRKDKKRSEKPGRLNQPSGRQAAELPEHTGKEEQHPATLHQGQGPDFQTQDPHLQEENEGLEGLPGSMETPGASWGNQRIPKPRNKQRITDFENPDEADLMRDTHKQDDDEGSFFNDNPEDTRRE